jgi:hypothetical protein
VLSLNEREMREVVHLPTLTHLSVQRMDSDAGSLLPELPRLRCLEYFTGALTAVFSDVMSRSAALDDLTCSVTFGNELVHEGPEEQRMSWSALLCSMPNLHRLNLQTEAVDSFLDVLPTHLPHLEQLVLRSWQSSTIVLAKLAHPTLQHSNRWIGTH